MITSNLIFYLIFIITVVVFKTISEQRKKYHITRLCVSYETGRRLPEEKSRKDILTGIGDGTYVMLLVSLFLVLLIGVNRETINHKLTDYSGKLPCLSLEQVEQSGKDLD